LREGDVAGAETSSRVVLLKNLARAFEEGGRLVVHEYFHYLTWQLLPVHGRWRSSYGGHG
jgi:hypothetical protein